MAIFALIDGKTHNVLGEFGSRAEAEAYLEALVAADASASADLRIEVDEDAEAPPEPRLVEIRR
jgi:hypothetical protein